MGRWVLLRGLAREKRQWLNFTDEFTGEVTEELMLLDLPGFGDQAHITPPVTIKGTTEKLRQQFLRLKGDRKNWNILGLSLGGMVALDWVARYPYDFESAVVINTSSKDAGAIWQRLSAFGFYKMGQALLSKSPRAREKAVLELCSNLHKKDPALLDQMTAFAEDIPVKGSHVIRQLTAGSQFMAPEKIKVPCLFLASLKDHLVDVRCSKILAERLGADIKFHPNAGHDLPLDDPKWVAERVREFEKKLSEPQPSTESST